MWTCPGDVNAVYWSTAPAGVDFTSNSPPANAQSGVIRLQQSSLTSAAPSSTTPYSGFVGPPTGARAIIGITSLPNISPNGFRHQYGSITCELIAAAVADQGQVYAAQYAPIMRKVGCVVPNGYDSGIANPDTPGTNYQLFAQRYSCVLPASESDLAAMSPEFYMGAAREGVYVPLRLSGPNQPFARSTPEGQLAVFGNDAGYFNVDVSNYPIGAVLCPFRNDPMNGVDPGIPWVFAGPTLLNFGAGYPALPSPLMFDSGYDNMNVGVVIWRGLTGASGGGFGSSIQVKTIMGLEIASNPTASARIFAENPAPYEPKAIEAYYAICLELKDAYPARYNSLESIFDAIGSVASKVWKVAEPVLIKVGPDLAKMAIDSTRGGLTGARPPSASGRLIASAPRVTYRAPSVARSTSVRKPMVKVAGVTRRKRRA
jgi:hypothetical protein